MIQITGNFTVNGAPFAAWFEQFRKAYPTLFANTLNQTNFEAVMRELKKMMCKSTISLHEFVGIVCFIYNETGGTFQSMKEISGGAGYYEAHGYHNKSAGRGLIQLTSDSVYRVALKQLGYDYDALSAQQLDALFLRKEVYLPAVCVYISNPYLAGSHWQKVQAGEFFAFGKAISGGADWYGTLYDNRCKALLNALQGQKIQQASPFKSAIGLILFVLVLLGILAYALYRYGFILSPCKSISYVCEQAKPHSNKPKNSRKTSPFG